MGTGNGTSLFGKMTPSSPHLRSLRGREGARGRARELTQPWSRRNVSGVLIKCECEDRLHFFYHILQYVLYIYLFLSLCQLL